MQILLKICDEFVASHELTYNVKKTFCIYIRPKWLKDIIDVPNLYLSERVVNLTTNHKHLGMFITDTMKDGMDINRQITCLYTRGSILIKRFRHAV